MAARSDFHILSEKTLHHAVDPALITYCPSMDLVALVTTDQQVLIYRLNGQRVYGAIQKAGKLRVASIRWKPNGQLIAIAWSDGSVRLVGAESGKIVHQFSAGKEVSDVTCMSWATNLTNRTASSIKQKKFADSWNSAMPTGAADDVLDLPRDLSLIDIETSLPKLSVLAAGGSEDVFSSRSSLDSLFGAFDPKDNNAVDVMVVGTAEGTIHLSIYDSFVIGSFTSPALADGAFSRLVLHASHKQYSTHALLLRASAPEKRLYFVPMDLRFVSASSDYLSLLASRSTALQNLLRYINQVQTQMNINETLAEKDNRNIVQALYHSVATGHTFPSVREWLVDELSERGHKRWDKAVTSGLETLRRLVHENLLPALERCSLILSRFSGIARFQGSNSSIGFTNQQINLIMDTVACLHLVSSKILIQVVDELELFAAFSSWLRHEIDRLASNSSSSPADDAAEREASIDHSKVILYLQTAMTSSPLAVYLGDSPETSNDNRSHTEQSLPMYDLLDKQLQKQERGLPYINSLPRVEFLCSLLTRQASIVFSQIAEAEKRNVLFGKAYEVGSAETNEPMHMRMTAEKKSVCETHIAYVPAGSKNTIQVVRILLSVENGISSMQSISSSSLQLGNGVVKDLNIWDDSEVLLLWKCNNTTSLLNVSYRVVSKANPGSFTMEYSPHAPNGKGSASAIFSDDEVLQQFTKYKPLEDSSFVPEKLELRERSSAKEEDSQRIVVLGNDKLHYKVLKFASPDTLSGGPEDEDISMS